MVAGERPRRSVICVIERPSASRKWRARATARRRSLTRSYAAAGRPEDMLSRYRSHQRPPRATEALDDTNPLSGRGAAVSAARILLRQSNQVSCLATAFSVLVRFRDSARRIAEVMAGRSG